MVPVRLCAHTSMLKVKFGRAEEVGPAPWVLKQKSLSALLSAAGI